MPRPIALAVLAATLAAAAAVPAFSSTTVADPLCYSASTNGTLPGYHAVGPYCEPYDSPVNCQTTSAGLAPTAGVILKYCVPGPVV